MALTKIGKEGITGISNASDANAITIDSSERVVIGTTTEGRADEGAGIFTIDGPDGGHAGMTIRSGTSNYGSIYFSDGTSGASEYASSIQFNHSTNKLALGIGGSDHLNIDSSGNVLINTSSATGHKMTVTSAAGAGSADFVGGSTNGYYAVRVDMPSTNTYGVLFRSNETNVGDIRINSSSTA